MIITKAIRISLLLVICLTGFCITSPAQWWRNTAKNNQVVGASATELLTASKPSLTLEIHYMNGYRLRSASVNSLISFIQDHLHKPSGIQVIEREINIPVKRKLSLEDIANIEKKHRTAYNTSKQVAVYILVTDGSSADEEALGTAYRNTSIALFGKTINRYAEGYSLTLKSKLESSTLQHEFGHLLGLVNLPVVANVNHNGSAEDGHCHNSSCLMYYKAHDEMRKYLAGQSAPGFDETCRSILRAAGGK